MTGRQCWLTMPDFATTPENSPLKHIMASGQKRRNSSRAGACGRCSGNEGNPSCSAPSVSETCLNISSSLGRSAALKPAAIAPPAASDQSLRFASTCVTGNSVRLSGSPKKYFSPGAVVATWISRVAAWSWLSESSANKARWAAKPAIAPIDARRVSAWIRPSTVRRRGRLLTRSPSARLQATTSGASFHGKSLATTVSPFAARGNVASPRAGGQ
jgi:hypothetical protein